MVTCPRGAVSPGWPCLPSSRDSTCGAGRSQFLLLRSLPCNRDLSAQLTLSCQTKFAPGKRDREGARELQPLGQNQLAFRGHGSSCSEVASAPGLQTQISERLGSQAWIQRTPVLGLWASHVSFRCHRKTGAGLFPASWPECPTSTSPALKWGARWGAIASGTGRRDLIGLLCLA